MTVVGSAEVIVRAITDRVEEDIRRAFSNVDPVLQEQGDRLGRTFSDSFSDSVDSNVTPQVSSALERAGREGGQAAGEAIERAVGPAGERAGNRAARGIVNALRGVGDGGIGDVFTRVLGDSFDRESRRASQALTQLIFTGNLVGTVLAGAAGGVSALVSGLFSIVAAAGQAVSALAVLPGLLGAVFQAGGALKLAFGGVGDAISAGMKDVGGSARSAATNSYAVVDAQKALARAVQQAARSRADANYRVSLAIRDLSSAESELEAVTNRLTAAKARAREELQQLGFSAEGAALAEKRAALSLEDAKAGFEAVRELDPDSRTFQEALLALEEADLAYRRAADRNKDLASENEKAQEAGIKGHDEVIQAQNDIIEAKNRVTRAEEQVTKARLEQARAAQDAAQSVADAQERVRRAQQSANKAVSAGAGSISAYQKALQGLSPEARNFVQFIISLQDEFARLRASAGREFFPALQEAIEPLVREVFPVLERQLQRTGGILGQYAIGVSSALTANTLLEEILKSQNDTLDIFNEKQENGKSAVENLTTVVLRLFKAIQPITQRFTEWIASLIESAEAATDTAEEMGNLTDHFGRAGDMASLLGDIVGNLFGVFRELGRAASPAGTGLLESFNQYLESLRELLAEPKKQESLGEFFADVADNVRALSDLTRAIGREFAQLGDNPGIKNFSEDILPAVEIFGDIGDQLTEVGPSLANFVNEFARVIEALTQTGQISTFFDTLATISGVLADIFKFLGDINSSFEKMTGINIGGILITVFAISRALGAATRVAGFFFKALSFNPRRITAGLKKVRDEIRKTGAAAKGSGKVAAPATAGATTAAINTGSLSAVDSASKKATKSTGRLRGAFSKLGGSIKGVGGSLLGLVGGPIGLLLISIPFIIKGFQALYKNSPEFRKFVDGLTDKLQELGKWFGEIFQKHILPIINQFFGWVNSNLPTIQGYFNTFGNFLTGTLLPAVSAVFGFFRDEIIPILVDVGSSIAESLTPVVRTLAKVFKDKIVPAVQSLIDEFVVLWPTIREVIKFVVKVQGKILQFAAKITGKVLPVIIKLIGKLVEFYANVVVKVISAVSNIIGKFADFGRALRDTFTKVKNFVTDVKDKFIEIKDAARDRVDQIVDFFKNLPRRMKDGISDLGTTIGQGISSGIGSVLNKAIGLINGLIRSANKLPKVNIPEISKISGFASGVRSFRGGFAIVGEEGPELVRLPPGSDVFSNSRTNDIMNRTNSSGVGSTKNDIVVNQNFYGPTTSGGRLQEIDWTMRYATKARSERVSGVAK